MHQEEHSPDQLCDKDEAHEDKELEGSRTEESESSLGLCAAHSCCSSLPCSSPCPRTSLVPGDRGDTGDKHAAIWDGHDISEHHSCQAEH